MSTTIPTTHLDLLVGPIIISLATIMPDGRPQLTPVWCSYQDGQIWVNTNLGRQKSRNMQERPQVTILAVDPTNTARYIEVRGNVVGSDDSDAAVQHINDLSWLYDNQPFRKLGPTEKRVIYKVQPTRINTGH